jgi:hypothetical protein
MDQRFDLREGFRALELHEDAIFNAMFCACYKATGVRPPGLRPPLRTAKLSTTKNQPFILSLMNHRCAEVLRLDRSVISIVFWLWLLTISAISLAMFLRVMLGWLLVLVVGSFFY